MIDRNLFLCKAKTIAESKWVYGYYVYDKSKLKYYIFTDKNITFTAFEVNPNTVCRCTGMKDINGNLIYEHDICRRFIKDFLIQDGTIHWNAKDGSFEWKFYDTNIEEYNGLYMDEWDSMQVIGNEFNNEERILCSAVKFTLKNKESPVIIAGYRHGDCFNTIRCLTDISEVVDEEQGFITSKNRFVDRIEAKWIALQANQLITKSLYKELISEDLY